MLWHDQQARNGSRTIPVVLPDAEPRESPAGSRALKARIRPGKILLVNKFLFLNGGSERVLFQERDYFRSLGIKVVDFSMANDKNVESDYAGHFIGNVDYHRAGGPLAQIRKALGFVHSPEAVTRLAGLVEQERPEIAHLHNIYHQITPSIIPMLKKKGLKVVLSLHDYKLVCPNYVMLDKGKLCSRCEGKKFAGPLRNHCMGSWPKELLLAAEAGFHKWRGSYDHVDAFIAPSRFMADMITAHRIPREKVVVIRNGIESERFQPTYEDEGYAVYLGRLSDEKGVETLLTAHQMMERPIKLRIIGTGPLLEKLRAAYPKAEFMGYRAGAELMELLQKSSFMVMPSEWYENAPMSALEAMGLGKPLIGSRIGGIPELIDEGETGLLFEMGDAGELAGKMDLLAADPELRRRMGRAAKAKQLADHDVKVRNEKVLDVYERLLTGAGASVAAKAPKVEGPKVSSAGETKKEPGEVAPPSEALIAVTYRCNAHCKMCNTWKFPTSPAEEVTAEDLMRLPGNYVFANITGGEPFLRKDIEDLIEVVLDKTERLVVSTNGYMTDRIVNAAKRFYPKVGFRVSIEGLPRANDEVRGLKNGFDHGLRTLLRLRDLGLEDIGFGITVSDANAKDMIELYGLADAMGMEFATAAMHNNYYFHKFDNAFHDVEMISDEFKGVAERLMRSKRPKNWFRAYFNYGLANYVRGNKRLLPCEVGSDLFFMDPFGEIMACNGLESSMGNIREREFNEIWQSDKARKVREQVSRCDKNCWMVGSVAPAMKKRLRVPAVWVAKNKLKSLMGKELSWCFEDQADSGNA